MVNQRIQMGSTYLQYICTRLRELALFGFLNTARIATMMALTWCSVWSMALHPPVTVAIEGVWIKTNSLPERKLTKEMIAKERAVVLARMDETNIPKEHRAVLLANWMGSFSKDIHRQDIYQQLVLVSKSDSAAISLVSYRSRVEGQNWRVAKAGQGDYTDGRLSASFIPSGNPAPMEAEVHPVEEFTFPYTVGLPDGDSILAGRLSPRFLRDPKLTTRETDRATIYERPRKDPRIPVSYIDRFVFDRPSGDFTLYETINQTSGQPIRRFEVLRTESVDGGYAVPAEIRETSPGPKGEEGAPTIWRLKSVKVGDSVDTSDLERMGPKGDAQILDFRFGSDKRAQYSYHSKLKTDAEVAAMLGKNMPNENYQAPVKDRSYLTFVGLAFALAISSALSFYIGRRVVKGPGKSATGEKLD
jgi:hypothetical protein